MSLKVLILKGSPREKGNSAVLAEQAAAGTRERLRSNQSSCKLLTGSVYSWLKEELKCENLIIPGKQASRMGHAEI